MARSSVVRFVSGDWDPALGHIRLRIEGDGGEEPQDFLLAAGDVQSLVILLLILSGKAGPRQAHGPGGGVRETFPLYLDSAGLGETEDGQTVLQLNVGQTELAFILSQGMTRDLGRSMLTLSAPSACAPAN